MPKEVEMLSDEFDSLLDIDIEDSNEEEVQVEESQFPIFASLDIENNFNKWCENEIRTAEMERAPLMDKVKDWRKIANNLDISGRETAWEGSSDINVPVIPIVLKTATARLRNTFNTRTPFWSIKPLNKHTDGPWIQRAEVLEKFFNIISSSRYDLNLYAKNSIIMTDLPIASTVWVRIPYTNLTRNIIQDGIDDTGDEVGEVIKEQVIKSGPEIDVIRTEDILYRDNFQDIQMAPWFGIKKHLSLYELKLEEDNNLWANVEDIKGQARYTQTDKERIDSTLRSTQSSPGDVESTGIYDIIEFWAYYDVNDDGVMEDILVHYHAKTHTILSASYNKLGVRPIRNIPFYMKPYSLEGQGVVELSKDLQQEINGLHNLRNDGIHMTESPVWAVKRGSGMRPKEQIFPGKVLFLNDPTQDIHLLQNSKQYIETEKLESMDYSYMERATGIQDISGGFSSQLLKSRDTASSQSLRMQAGSEVFMGIIEGVDLAYQDIAEMIYRQLVANRVEVIEKERKAERLSEKDIATLEETLNVDLDTIPYALAFKARISDGAETFEGKKQSILNLVTIYTQYVTQIIPLIMQTYGPEAPMVQEMMQKFTEGATSLMEKVFVFFGEEDTKQYMLSSDRIEMMNEIMQKMQGNMGQLQGQGQGLGQGQGNQQLATQGQGRPMQ